MQAIEAARYRLNLAEGFLIEAREDIGLRRWRSCVDNSQLAVENAAKVALALLGPVGHTHDPASLPRKALVNNLFPMALHDQVVRLTECAELLGLDVHIESDYGNEDIGKTPWELFGQTEAEQALNLAEEAISLAKQIIETR